MKAIFCSNPLERKTVDPDYQNEFDIALKHGFDTGLINFEELIDGNFERATRRIAKLDDPEPGVYRGWMMKPDVYSALWETLRAKNILLINDPMAYRHCHYLPESYPIIRDSTPQTVWLKTKSTPDYDALMEALKPFGEHSIIVKDFVKSQKHHWADACFIPNAGSRADVERVVGKFLELQGEDLNEGLVFREYVALAPLTVHSKSGMPLTIEFRVFILFGEPLVTLQYWEEGDYGLERLDPGAFLGIAKRVQSNFFTMDVAKKQDGEWTIVELGDGQVAGLPERCDIDEFYARLAQGIKAHSGD